MDEGTRMMIEDTIMGTGYYFLFFGICAAVALFVVLLAFLACYFLYVLAKAYALVQRYTVRTLRRRFVEGRL